jgi:acyl-CoA thioesterase YciA
MESTDTQPQATQPRGELALRMVAMPADTNPSGDIFGGWIM